MKESILTRFYGPNRLDVASQYYLHRSRSPSLDVS